tara:strand:+ start:3811 stop:4119 length:309 start_codon:yes stop_codon:yes gene_type:complete
MNGTEKLAMAVPVMRGSLMEWCGHLNAIHMVGSNEHPPSPALDEVLSHVREMHGKVKDMCGAYDRLRSLIGELEIEQKVESPRFYVDKQAGKTCKGHCPTLI